MRGSFSIAGGRVEVGHTPGRIAKVDLLWSIEGVETAEEERAEVVRPCTGDSLYAVGYHEEGE